MLTKALTEIVDELSENPVQTDILISLFDELNDGPQLMGGDDPFDFANYIAALRKAANYIEHNQLKQRTEELMKIPGFENQNSDFFIEHAMNDWKTFPPEAEELWYPKTNVNPTTH